MKRDTLTEYLVFSFAVVLVYTVTEFVVSTLTGVSHDTVTTCIFAFFGTEIGACAFIKIAGRKKENDTKEDEWDGLDVNEDEEAEG
jgi:hypothetical protein